METKVNILGEDYQLRINSEEGLERLQRVALFVDRTMREVASSYLNLSPKQIAVLAALNIADECLSLQEKALDREAERAAAQPQPAAADPSDAVVQRERLAGMADRIEEILGKVAG